MHLQHQGLASAQLTTRAQLVVQERQQGAYPQGTTVEQSSPALVPLPAFLARPPPPRATRHLQQGTWLMV
jgi:hypothetical protein